MRIWLAPSAFFPRRGGVEELTLKLAQQLQILGHDVTVITHIGDLLEASAIVEGIHVERLFFDSPRRSTAAVKRFLIGQRDLQRQLSRLPKPDVVHIQCPSNQTAAVGWWTRRHGVPLVITSQGETVMDATQIYQHSAYLRIVLRLASRHASALTSCSKWTAMQAAAVAPAFAQSKIIYNAVSLRDWDIAAAPATPSFCAWGRHVPQKGLDLLLLAFQRLLETRPDASLMIGGDGPEQQRLRYLAGDNVTFLGSLDRRGVADMLAACRVAVVPSRLEPFGIVALEALAAGRQLVYSTHGGLGEASGGLGLPVDPYDVTAFAAQLEAAISAPIDVENGRRRCDELSWDRVTHQYVQLYQAVLT